jgi:hypothetical protein
MWPNDHTAIRIREIADFERFCVVGADNYANGSDGDKRGRDARRQEGCQSNTVAGQ